MENYNLTTINVFAVVTIAILTFWYVIHTRRMVKEQKRIATRDATMREFDKWWNKLSDQRGYFYKAFLKAEYKKHKDEKGFKQLIGELGKDGKNLKELCGFFDRIGWLGAADLIDVEYILGPMQHAVRRVWWAVERFILFERKLIREGSYRYDPVFHIGFQWLFDKTEKKKQDKIVEDKFKKPRFGKKILSEMAKGIDEDEKKYLKELEEKGLRRKGENCKEESQKEETIEQAGSKE